MGRQLNPGDSAHLPTTVGTDVVYVRVFGHYVEVVTTSAAAFTMM